MSAQFTPGPWERRVDETGSVIRIEQAANHGNSGLVAYVTPCTLLNISKGSIPKDGGSNFANARLIAAAPDLYGALVGCVSRLRNCAKFAGNDDWAIEAMCEPFETALAKVRGDHATQGRER